MRIFNRKGRCFSDLLLLIWAVAFCFFVAEPSDAIAQIELPGYAQAEDAFMRLRLDERVKLQVLLTAAGYWPAVPDAEFSGRLFNAVLRFQVDNGFVPLGILNEEQMDRLVAIAAPYLNKWRFALIRHPFANAQIWVPIGLPLAQESTPTGLNFVNRGFGHSADLRLLSRIQPPHFVRIPAQQAAT